MQFLYFLSFLQKTWTIICDFWNFFLFSKNVDYHMQFLKFLSLFKKCGLSYAIYEIFFSSPKICTIKCNFYNFFLFPKNVDYCMQFLKFLSLPQKHGLIYATYEISSLLQKRGLSITFYEICFSSPITWTTICNL